MQTATTKRNNGQSGRGSVRRGLMRTACVVVSCGAVMFAAGPASGGEEPKQKQKQPAKQSKQSTKQRAKQPARQPAKRPAAKPAQRPSQPKARPTRKATPRKQASPRPSQSKRKPAARPSRQPSRQPAASPSRRPTTRPATRPSTRPAMKPTTHPSAQPSTRPAVQPASTTRRPSREPVQTGSSAGKPAPVYTEIPVSAVSGSSPKPVRRLGSIAKGAGSAQPGRPSTVSIGPGNPGAGKHVVTQGNVPAGFDPDNPLKRRGKLAGTGLGSGSVIGGGHDDGLDDGSGEGHHDDDAHHDDGHHDDHHGAKHSDWCKGCSYCYKKWYIVINDYDHDGYYDYACTNSGYTVWWYGGYGSWGWSSGYGYYGRPYWYGRNRYRYYRGPVYGPDVDLTINVNYEAAEPEPAPEIGTYEMSPLEVGRMLMAAGASDDAIDAYNAHLDIYPDDWVVVRELGIAKMLGRSYVDGVALVHYAYSSDPSLAAQPIDSALFAGSKEVLREAVVDLVRWGHRNPSAGAWLGVAALMQSEERDAVAMNMIDRAVQHGLDPAIGDAMRAELTRY